MAVTISDTYEYQLRLKGHIHIAGIDEAGRGALAGPVVAAAVMLPTICQIDGLNDSKKLTPSQRELVFTEIRKKASAIGIGIVDNRDIDKHNILQATFMAMRAALENLSFRPGYILIDGNQRIPGLALKQQPIVKGDSLSCSIAAASVIAKVTRDALMEELHTSHPEYDWKTNKGYGTAKHKDAIFHYGLSPFHRESFTLSSQLTLFS